MSPHALPTPCPTPGCPELTPAGTRCQKHTREKERERGTSTERGYDYTWQKVRRAFLSAHPLCNRCDRPTRATVVHHLDEDPTGPNRLNPTNLEALCRDCHERQHDRRAVR